MTSSSSTLSFHQIMQEMQRVKEVAQEDRQSPSKPHMPPLGDWRSSSAPEYNNHGFNSRPRSPPPVGSFRWNRCSADLGPTLRKQLYRRSTGDTSGKMIRWIERDEGGELAGKWLPGMRCQTYHGTMPSTTSVMCSKRYQSRLQEHTAKTIDKVESLFVAMPDYTTRLRNAKAKVGSDLNDLQLTQHKILDALQVDTLNDMSYNGSRLPRSRSRSNSPTMSRASLRPPSSPFGAKEGSPEVFHHVVTRPSSRPSSRAVTTV